MVDRRRPSARSSDLLRRLFGGTMTADPDLPKPPRLLVFKPPAQRKLTAKEKTERAELAEWFHRHIDRLQREGKTLSFTWRPVWTRRKATPTEWALTMERFGLPPDTTPPEFVAAKREHYASIEALANG